MIARLKQALPFLLTILLIAAFVSALTWLGLSHKDIGTLLLSIGCVAISISNERLNKRMAKIEKALGMEGKCNQPTTTGVNDVQN